MTNHKVWANAFSELRRVILRCHDRRTRYYSLQSNEGNVWRRGWFGPGSMCPICNHRDVKIKRVNHFCYKSQETTYNCANCTCYLARVTEESPEPKDIWLVDEGEREELNDEIQYEISRHYGESVKFSNTISKLEFE